MQAHLALTPVARARAFFAAQAVAGALWWIAVFASDHVRTWTLGAWDPHLLVVPDLVLFVGASAVAALGNRGAGAVVAVWAAAVAAALAGYGLVERTAGWGILAMTAATVGSILAAATLWCGRLPIERFFAGPFAFRVAKPATNARHLRRSVAQLIVFWTAFFVVVPVVLVAVERRVHLDWAVLQRDGWNLIGAVAFGVASALGIWSCGTMALLGEGTPLPAETARKLVVRGPYRYVRNPMAVAGAVQTASVGLWSGSWMVVAIAVAGALTWNVFIRPAEEADLAARFGDRYECYRAAVRCWLPSRPWPGDAGGPAVRRSDDPAHR